METADLKPLNLGERMVTIARLLAAEHVRQELLQASERELVQYPIQPHMFSEQEIDRPKDKQEAA
jgi:hypothetical protein